MEPTELELMAAERDELLALLRKFLNGSGTADESEEVAWTARVRWTDINRALLLTSPPPAHD